MKNSMHKIFFFILTSFPFLGNAQTIKTPPTIGDVIVGQTVEAKNLSEGNAGTGQVWDFTNLTDSLNTNSTEYIDPINTPFYQVFPSSNLCTYIVNGADTTYSYAELDNNQNFYSLGAANEQAGIVYEDNLLTLKYPFYYGDKFTDTFYTNPISNVTNYGNAEVKADASGTLKLKNGDFKVLRLKSKTYQVNDYGNGTVLYYDIESYSFYDSTHISALFSINYIHVYDNDQTIDIYVKSASYTKQFGASVKRANNNSLNVYPNPTKGVVEISGNYSQNSTFEIKDIQGKTVQTGPLNFNNSIDMNGLPEGIYLLHLQDKSSNKLYIQKIIKTN